MVRGCRAHHCHRARRIDIGAALQRRSRCRAPARQAGRLSNSRAEARARMELFRHCVLHGAHHIPLVEWVEEKVALGLQLLDRPHRATGLVEASSRKAQRAGLPVMFASPPELNRRQPRSASHAARWLGAGRSGSGHVFALLWQLLKRPESCCRPITAPASARRSLHAAETEVSDMYLEDRRMVLSRGVKTI